MKNTAAIRDMFEDLVPGYDRFNRLSSLGLDQVWRRELAGMMPPGSHVLDVGTGTGDLAKEVAERDCTVVATDFAENMIRAAEEKLKSYTNVSFQVAASDELPFEPRTFDGLCSAFVIRNLHHGGILSQSMREFYRVLKTGGLMIHLELVKPPKGVLSWGHKAYMNTFLPVIGWLNFGSRWPKNYLSNTIANFPEPWMICQQMRWAGFDRVCHYPLTNGIAALFVGVRC